MAFIVIALSGGLTWLLNKIVDPDSVGTLKDTKNNPIHITDPYNPVELGYGRQLDIRKPERVDKTTRIGEWNEKNPLPYIRKNPISRYNETSTKIPNFPNIKEKNKRSIHQTYNTDQYWRFDQYFGLLYKDYPAPALVTPT